MQISSRGERERERERERESINSNNNRSLQNAFEATETGMRAAKVFPSQQGSPGNACIWCQDVWRYQFLHLSPHAEPAESRKCVGLFQRSCHWACPTVLFVSDNGSFCQWQRSCSWVTKFLCMYLLKIYTAQQKKVPLVWYTFVYHNLRVNLRCVHCCQCRNFFVGASGCLPVFHEEILGVGAQHNDADPMQSLVSCDSCRKEFHWMQIPWVLLSSLLRSHAARTAGQTVATSWIWLSHVSALPSRKIFLLNRTSKLQRWSCSCWFPSVSLIAYQIQSDMFSSFSCHVSADFQWDFQHAHTHTHTHIHART